MIAALPDVHNVEMCGDIEPRDGVIIHMAPDRSIASLGCEATGRQWVATCQNGSWVEESAYPCPMEGTVKQFIPKTVDFSE